MNTSDFKDWLEDRLTHVTKDDAIGVIAEAAQRLQTEMARVTKAEANTLAEGVANADEMLDVLQCLLLVGQMTNYIATVEMQECARLRDNMATKAVKN